MPLGGERGGEAYGWREVLHFRQSCRSTLSDKLCDIVALTIAKPLCSQPILAFVIPLFVVEFVKLFRPCGLAIAVHCARAPWIMRREVEEIGITHIIQVQVSTPLPPFQQLCAFHGR